MYTYRIGLCDVVLNEKWFGRKRDDGLTGEDSGELDLGKITTVAKGATIPRKGKKHQNQRHTIDKSTDQLGIN